MENQRNSCLNLFGYRPDKIKQNESAMASQTYLTQDNNPIQRLNFPHAPTKLSFTHAQLTVKAIIITISKHNLL